MSLTYFPTGSDITVLWSGLKDHVTGSFINDATVTGVLKDAAGSTVQSITFAYVAASDGNYRGTITAAANLVATYAYELTVTATAGSLQKQRTLAFPARKAGGAD